LLDHFERGRLLLTGVELLVIDEADRMLDMGFIPDIERICKLVPFTRQTLFFTATMPAEIRRITEQFLHNPVRVEVSKPATTVATTSQFLARTGRDPHEKRDTLRRLLRTCEGFKNAIVFCNRKREVAQLHRSLLRSHRAIGPHLNNSIDNHDVIGLQSRFYYPQSFGQLSRLYMTQPGDIFGIHNVHETLILIRANRSISNQERIVFRTRGHSHPDKVSWR